MHESAIERTTETGYTVHTISRIDRRRAMFVLKQNPICEARRRLARASTAKSPLKQNELVASLLHWQGNFL